MTAIAMPHIWVPRRDPWRSPLEWFTQGKLQRDPVTGKGKRSINGRLRSNSATRTTCCCPPTPCAPCLTDTTPETISVLFENVENCGCQPSGLTSSRRSFIVVDGTYTLGPGSTLCRYVYQEANSSVVAYSGNTVCSGSPAATSAQLQIALRFNTSSIQVSATMGGDVSATLFDGTVAGLASPYDCSATYVFTNTVSCSGSFLNTGGTCTMNP